MEERLIEKTSEYDGHSESPSISLQSPSLLSCTPIGGIDDDQEMTSQELQ